jgi:hypothetical protein
MREPRDYETDRRCLAGAFARRRRRPPLSSLQRDLIEAASLFATTWVSSPERRLMDTCMLPIMDAFDSEGERFYDELLASAALSEALL